MNTARHIDERRITAKAFIGAETAQRDLDASLAGGLGDEPGIDAVGRRQVHGIKDGRQIRLELRPIDGAHDVTGAVARGDLGGERCFVERLAAKLRERQRDGQGIARAEFGHRPEQRAGIESGGQKHRDGNIGHEMVPH